VPRLDAELGTQPETDRAVAGRAHRVDVAGGPHPVDLALLEAVDAGADGGEARERVHGTVGLDEHGRVGGRRGPERDVRDRLVARHTEQEQGDESGGRA
jgi:hypothetical protein